MKQIKSLTVIMLICLAFSTLSGTLVFVQACNPASKLVFTTGTSQVLQAGTISNQITVQLQDASNKTVNAASNITVNLITNASSTGHFYSDKNGQNQILVITIKQGQNSSSFFYGDTTAGHPTLVASSQSLNSATTQFTLKPSGLDHFAFQPINNMEIAGLSFSITISAKDIYGNIITSYTDSNILSDSTGTITPTSTTAFQAGVWSGQVNIASPNSAVTISTSGSSKTGISNSFKVNQYTITTSAGTGGSITPNGPVNKNYGSSQTFTIIGNMGYHIAKVVVDGTTDLGIVNTYTFTNVMADHAINAVFAADTTPSPSPSPSPTVSPSPSPVPSPTLSPDSSPVPSPTLSPDSSPVPSPTLSPDSSPVPSPTLSPDSSPVPSPTLSPTSSFTLSSTSSQPSLSMYDIIVISAHGSPTTSAYVKAGSSFTVLVTTPDGDAMHRWVCTGYSIDGGKTVSDTRYTFTNVQAAHTITFNWQEQYYLAVISKYGVTAGSGWYNLGSTAHFTVTSKDTAENGIQVAFVSWSGVGLGAYTGSGTLQYVIMNNPITETATWAIPSTSLYTVAETALILFALLLLMSLLLVYRRRRKKKQLENSAKP